MLKDLYFILRKNNRLYYFGIFPDWFAAEIESKKFGNSYQSDYILDKIAKSTELVRKHQACYEQDGVAFFEENNNYPLLSAFFYILADTNKLNVTDFGGSLGSTYFRYHHLLNKFPIKWNIVEQAHFVEYGKKNIPEIDFYYDSSAVKDSNTLLLSSVMMYISNIYDILEKTLQHKFDYIIVDETAFTKDDTDQIRLQHVPESIYSAIYPLRLFSLTNFKSFFCNHNYKLVYEWNYFERGGEGISIIDGFKRIPTKEKGFLFKYDSSTMKNK